MTQEEKEKIDYEIKANVMQLQEVGDFGAENFIEPPHLMQGTNFQATTEPPIYCRCC